MSKSSISVLQSLTATYTDSEGEDEDRMERKRRSSSLTSDNIVELEKESTATNTATTVATPESNKSGTNTPQSGSSISGMVFLNTKNFSIVYYILKYIKL